ncbi:MAG: sulfurtransferase [endosymbiont of Galathealinum brachiosum]|uniref:Sulfurtransferase n=1 Tax=endosymbiont of Galathealinum brachiosum TaxID=2200906 RepID=A0A370DFU8_9GAMM|nr:MAG: sulfurtransferase [endosymbiont of Galathealinum brachiosum]
MLFKMSGIIIFLLMLTGCTEPPYTNLDNAQLKLMIDKGIPVYDVRRVDEWRQTGVIKGSKLLTIISSEARVNPEFMPNFTRANDINSQVILICRTGNRTRKLATYLIENYGYKNIYNVQNGISHWIREGNSVVQARI